MRRSRRRTSAEVIGRFNIIFPRPESLEDAPSRTHRRKFAARARSALGVSSARLPQRTRRRRRRGQTAEPPIARPARPQAPVTSNHPPHWSRTSGKSRRRRRALPTVGAAALRRARVFAADKCNHGDSATPEPDGRTADRAASLGADAAPDRDDGAAAPRAGAGAGEDRPAAATGARSSAHRSATGSASGHHAAP